jgi:hypothetical protein
VLQVEHGEFVTEWPSSFTQTEADSDQSSSSSKSSTSSSSFQQQSSWLQQLPSYCRDLAVVVMGQPPVNFVHKSNLAGSSSSNSSTSNSSSTGVPGAGSVSSGQVSRNADGVVAGVSSSDVPLEWN